MPWFQTQKIDSKKFTCGYCGNVVASASGYFYDGKSDRVYICPHCEKPREEEISLEGIRTKERN